MDGRSDPIARVTDPAPVEIVNAGAITPLLIICDHGGCAVPAALHDAVGPMGLSADELRQHIGWDIGAAAVARGLAARLKATAVVAVYSRLLIDPNRPLGDPDCIPARSDGRDIPANRNLGAAEMRARANAFYWPYHQAIDEQLARLRQLGPAPLLLSMHSFTPALKAGGGARPMHAGVMSNCDRRLADALLAGLRTEPGLTVTYNEPYSAITHGYCLKAHGLAQGIAHAQVEIRQDLIESEPGQARWADLLTRVVGAILAGGALHTLEHY